MTLVVRTVVSGQQLRNSSILITGKIRAYYPVEDENIIVWYMTRSEKKAVGVVFINTTNTFQYKIRDKNEWNTGELYVQTESQENGPYPKGVAMYYCLL